MTAFIDERLDERVSYGFIARRSYIKERADIRNGMVNRNAVTARPKHTYTAPFKRIAPALHSKLLEAFHSTWGVSAFRFKDWSEYLVDNEQIGTADGTTDQQLQIIKPYTFGGVTNAYRTIRKPVDSTRFNVANGYAEDAIALTVTEDTGGGAVPLAHTVDYDTGIITFTGTSGAIIRVTCEFDVPVFFTEESMAFVIENYQAHSGDVVLEEDLRA